MKLEKIVSVAASVLVAALTACSSGGDEPTSQTASEDLASPSTTKPTCAAGEKICLLENANGTCSDQCVKDTVLCGTPSCRVCDPVGTAPRAGCQWSTTACEWECPVCDPPPPPEKQGCTWDPNACVWLCL